MYKALGIQIWNQSGQITIVKKDNTWGVIVSEMFLQQPGASEWPDTANSQFKYRKVNIVDCNRYLVIQVSWGLITQAALCCVCGCVIRCSQTKQQVIPKRLRLAMRRKQEWSQPTYDEWALRHPRRDQMLDRAGEPPARRTADKPPMLWPVAWIENPWWNGTHWRDGMIWENIGSNHIISPTGTFPQCWIPAICLGR